MLGCWQGQIVVTSSQVPKALAKSLLEAGATAVVCWEAAATTAEAPTAAVAEFFGAFYDVLLSGRPIVKALAHAGTGCTLPYLAQCLAVRAGGSLNLAVCAHLQ